MPASTVFQSQLPGEPPSSSLLPQAPDAIKTIGKHRVLRTIGAGAMGVVYECLQTDLDRRVAVKVMRPWGAAPAEQVKRFEREARAAARLSHPHVVQVFDVGQENGLNYIVMEYVDGQSLQDLLGSSYLTLETSLRILHYTALALHAAHEQGVIHRDLKPSNILVDRAGRPRIVDFGLAKSVSDKLSLSREGDLVGTPRYMSPEQIVSPADEIDGRSDLFALGAVMFEMLAGRPAFDGPTMLATLQQVVDAPSPRLEEARPEAPSSVARICDKALAKERDERYATAEQMAVELRRALLSLAGGAAAEAASEEAVLQAFQPVRAAAEKNVLPPPSKSRRLVAAIIGGALLAAIAVGLWRYFATGGERSPEAAAAAPAVDYKTLRKEVVQEAREQLSGPLKVAQTSSPRDGWKSIIEDLTVVLKQSPDDIESLKLRGRALRRTGECLAATNDFSAVLERRPNDIEARLERMLANYQLYCLYLGNLNEPHLRPLPPAALAPDIDALKKAGAHEKWAAEMVVLLSRQDFASAEALANRRPPDTTRSPAESTSIYPPDLSMLEADLLLRAAGAVVWEEAEENETLTPSQRLGARASRALRKGLDADPNHVGLLFLKANSLQQRIEWEDVEGEGRDEVFRRARPQFDSACDRLRLATVREGCDTSVARAVLLNNVGWGLPSLDQVQEGLSCRPTVPQLYSLKAWLRLQNPEDGTLSTEILDRIARDLEPGQEAAAEEFGPSFTSAQIHIAAGRWEDARRDLRMALRTTGPEGCPGLPDHHRQWLAASPGPLTPFLNLTRDMLNELPVRQELRTELSRTIVSRLSDEEVRASESLEEEQVRSMRAWAHYSLAEAFAAQEDRGSVLEQIGAALSVRWPEVTPQSFRDHGAFSGWNEDSEFVALYEEFKPAEPPEENEEADEDE